MKNLLLLSALIIISYTSKNAFSQNVIVRIKLAAINDSLQYNQPAVFDNSCEYNWFVGVDVDDDLNTGFNGFDVGFVLIHFKFPGSTPIWGGLVANNQCETWVNTGSFWTTANLLNCWIDYSDTAIVMEGNSSWPELVGFTSNSKFTVNAYSYNGITPYTDTTSKVSVSQTLYDPKNDVVRDYLDIKKVSITYPGIIGIKESIANNVKLLFAPNPFNDKSKIMIMGGNVFENYFLIVYNSNGQEVRKINNIQQGADVYFEKENLSPGLYFYNLVGETQLVNKGKFIIE